MKIILMYKEDQYVEVLNLTEEEEKQYREGISYDDFSSDDYDVVSKICIARDIQTGIFDPSYFVIEDKLPVFDEKHQEEPLLTL